LKVGIYDELETNLFQIEHKTDTARRMLEALGKKATKPASGKRPML